MVRCELGVVGAWKYRGRLARARCVGRPANRGLRLSRYQHRGHARDTIPASKSSLANWSAPMTLKLALTMAFIVGLLLQFSAGCSNDPNVHASRERALSSHPAAGNLSDVNDSGFRSLMGSFAVAPDEAHFRQFLSTAQHSDDSMIRTVWDYNEFSKGMTPVDPPAGFQWREVEQRLRARPAADFRLVGAMMVIIRSPWRRWTMARFLGQFAGPDMLPRIRLLLQDDDASVREEARRAIDELTRRIRAGESL